MGLTLTLATTISQIGRGLFLVNVRERFSCSAMNRWPGSTLISGFAMFEACHFDAFSDLTNTADNLLQSCVTPCSQPLEAELLGEIRRNLEAAHWRCLSGLNIRDTPPFIAITEAEKVGEWVDTIARDGRALAELLHDRPELPNLPYTLWAKSQQLLYKSVSAATHNLQAFRNRVEQHLNQAAGHQTKIASEKMPLVQREILDVLKAAAPNELPSKVIASRTKSKYAGKTVRDHLPKLRDLGFVVQGKSNQYKWPA